MHASGFVRFVSVAIGVAAIPVVALALANAAAFPRALSTDAIRFGTVVLGGGLCLGLVFAHRLAPALRQAALQTEPGAVRVLCALAIGILALTARLAGVPAAAIGLAAGLLLLAYVVPGLLFRGIAGRPGTSLRELSVVAGQNMRRLPRSRRLAFGAIVGLPFLGVVPLMLGPETIPSSGWAAASRGAAVLGGFLSAIVFFGILFSAAPVGEQRRVLPRMLLWATLWFGIANLGLWALLAEGVTAAAAAVWGSEASQRVVVLNSQPAERRRGCRGVLEIMTATGPKTICNLSQEFLTAVAAGDVLVVGGRTTAFGQTARTLTLAERGAVSEA